MKKICSVLCLVILLLSVPALAAPVKHGQCYTAEQLTTLDKQDVTGVAKGLCTVSLPSSGTTLSRMTPLRKLAG